MQKPNPNPSPGRWESYRNEAAKGEISPGIIRFVDGGSGHKHRYSTQDKLKRQESTSATLVRKVIRPVTGTVIFFFCSPII